MLPGADVLRFRDYRNLWLAQLTSQFGDSVYFLVFLFMAQRISGRPEVAGFIAMIQAVPFIVLTPIAGVIADRVNRRQILLLTDLFSAAITLIVAVGAAFHATPPIWVLAIASFSLSSIKAFFFPARSAAIPQLLPPERVAEANGLAESTQHLMGMIGLAVSGSLLAVINAIAPQAFFSTACLFNSASFLGSAYFVAKLPSLQPVRNDLTSEPLNSKFGAAWKQALLDIKEGIKVLVANPISRLALPINMLVSLSISAFMIVYIEANSRWYGGGFGSLALIEFSFSATCVIFSLVVGRMTIHRVGLAFALGTLGCGILVALMALCRPYWLFVLANALCGVFLPFVWIPMGAYMQTAFADGVRGRVNAAWNMSWVSVQPLALAGIGPLLNTFKIEGSFVLMGVGMVFASLIGLASRPFLAPQADQAA